MITLHPNVLEKDGRKEFVVLPFEEFERIAEELSLYEDLKDLREAKAQEQNLPTYSLSEAKNMLGLQDSLEK